VDDANFIKLVAILRIAVPYTGMILSTRESPAMRDALLAVGMSQVGWAGARGQGFGGCRAGAAGLCTVPAGWVKCF
jgi:2-iminoacetate synthase